MAERGQARVEVPPLRCGVEYTAMAISDSGVIGQDVVFHCDQTMQPAAFGIRRRKTGNSVLE